MMLELVFNGFDITRITGNVFYFILFLIVFDILTGILASAKERKINSSINFDGLIRKVGVMVGLVFVTVIDVYFQTNGLVTKIGAGLLVAYEGLSIIENLSRIGVNLNFLTKYFDPEKVGKKDKK